MKYRTLGSSGLNVSSLGFGCGAVGGLLVRGEFSEMVRTVAYAVDSGITYFDTAALYGNGASERNLGKVLHELKPKVVVGTKVRLGGDDLEDIHAAVVSSVEASLSRLQMERVDLIQLHNPIGPDRDQARGWITVDDVAIAAEALKDVVQQGKAGAWGINGLGETKAVHEALRVSLPQTIQVCYNLLNPSAATLVASDFPFQDYERLFISANEFNTGIIAIRILAGGALSGVPERHPLGSSEVEPIATSSSYSADAQRAQSFQVLVDAGHAQSVIEAAIRFAVYTNGPATSLVGISSYEQLQQAITYVERGPMDGEALSMIRQLSNSNNMK